MTKIKKPVNKGSGNIDTLRQLLVKINKEELTGYEVSKLKRILKNKEEKLI